MLSEGEKLELATSVADALRKAFNRGPKRTVGESMQVLGLALHLYFTLLQKALEEGEE